MKKENFKFRFYYRKLLGLSYLVLSLVWVIYKGVSTLGIGVDAIPSEIRNSTILTGNNLGMLGNVEQLPKEDTVNNFGKEHPQFIGIEEVKKHTFAQEYLSKNDVKSAWKVLLLK